MDSWGKFPSGIQRSNVYELGSFSQCFHIERNGIGYQTQYCLAQFEYKSKERKQENSSRYCYYIYDKNVISVVNHIIKYFFNSTRPNTTITIGICLPKVCSTDNLESVVNEKLHVKANDITVRIPRELCQYQENAANFNAIDFVIM